MGDTPVLSDSNGINCSTNGGAPSTATILDGSGTNIARATPTSSDQVNEYNHENDDSSAVQRSQHQNSNNICDLDNNEEVIVDNTDDEECVKEMPSLMERTRSVDRNR